MINKILKLKLKNLDLSKEEFFSLLLSNPRLLTIDYLYYDKYSGFYRSRTIPDFNLLEWFILVVIISLLMDDA